MPAYHQLGHHSENLLGNAHLGMFEGCILSPVNYNEQQTSRQLTRLRKRRFDTVFDPQLYVPHSSRGELGSWSYFPSDIDTADLSSEKWWDNIVDRVAEVALRLEPSAVCSPAPLYKTYSSAYFADTVRIGGRLQKALNQSRSRAVQTIVVGMADLTSAHHRNEIASIVTGGRIEEVYLVLVSNTEPRRELTDVEELTGAISFIDLLEKSGIRVTVGYCSSDVLLWKAAGATNCATGKFFNLRRFTKTRFDEPGGGGGGLLPYWFEQGLVAFLREADLARIRALGLVSAASLANPLKDEIFAKADSGEPWVALGWQQYMHWFGTTESDIGNGSMDVDAVFDEAERSWELLAAKKVFMEEVPNNGRWVRPWRRALAEAERA